ncbi:unnamed protein product [Mucor hiemalis]
MAIVCEQFTTSKLSSFADLHSIATYGFRGEALASISHVAHVTITTKTADSPCAYRALYSDGALKPAKGGQSADPKPCAGNNGTQITAEDLFFNTPIRIKALQSAAEEYRHILDVVTRYAVHNAGVSFTCRKQGANMSDVQTSEKSSTVDNIRTLYGAVGSELLPVEKVDDNLHFKVKGYVSNANYSMKKMTMLLFINHRSVESSNIKKAIDAVYSTLLPKDSHPFIYLSLEIHPKYVDVNVHPTKKEVKFLNEDQIIDSIVTLLQETLENANHSRTFFVQTLLPGATRPTEDDIIEKPPTATPGRKQVAEYKYVRTDSAVTTLHSYLNKQNTSSTPAAAEASEDVEMIEESQVSEKRARVPVSLISILNLCKMVKSEEDKNLTHIFSNHTFISCVDDLFALIQNGQNIYIVNYNAASEELFYQVILQEFQNFGELKLAKPILIRECVLVAIEMEKEKGQVPEDVQESSVIAESIAKALVDRAEMLEVYFSVKISPEGYLVSLPLILRGYIPCLDKLPLFLLRLGTEVDWTEEQNCFDTFSRELAIFYSLDAPINQSDHDDYIEKVEHIIFPSFKTHFSAPTKLKPYVTQLANLNDLYKIFERC